MTGYEWLVGSYEEGQRWPDPSSSSRRLDQQVYVCGRENWIGAHQVNKHSTLPIDGLRFSLIHVQKYDHETKKQKGNENNEQKREEEI